MKVTYTLYNFAMWLGKLFLCMVSHTARLFCSSRKSKFVRFALGQDGVLSFIRSHYVDSGKETVWLHMASLGEYAVARPIIKKLHSDNYTIVLTVFSPSAYEVLGGRTEKDDADYVFYLPWDTRHHAKQFLDIVHPAKAVFIISEYWINYLRELGRRHIPTYFVSSLIPQDSYLLKWYAMPIRKAIPRSTTFMALDEETKNHLNIMGFERVTIMGDPLFDNALSIAQTPYTNDIIERFCATASDGVLVAGSISDMTDLTIVSTFANSHRHVKCLFVPHEISEENLNEIKCHLDSKAERYSVCTPETDFSGMQVLIIDFIGALSRIYRYGRWAYVGGGFTPYLHSVIEPVVYGLPVSFGPYIYRKVTPQEMMDLGIGKMVHSAEEFSSWIDGLASNEEEMSKIRKTALEYASRSGGATARVVQTIKEKYPL